MVKLSREQQLCEEAKRLLFGKESSDSEHAFAAFLLLQAVNLGSVEAKYMLGRLLLEGKAVLTAANDAETGMRWLCEAARAGYASACVYLNHYFSDRYEQAVGAQFAKRAPQPLTDFNGKRIQLRRTGLHTPVDAVLEFKNGENVLTLSVNVAFSEIEDAIRDPEAFYQTVVRGIEAWNGEYEVFGGQQLRVVVNVTTDDRLYDSVYVIPMTKNMQSSILETLEKLCSKRRVDRVRRLLESKRSATAMGLFRWSVHSRKLIYIHSLGGAFDEYDEIYHVVKHEFGHALGLGDLYKSPEDGLQGVKTGLYREIDNYAMSDEEYFLVMCDHHGPISNNDIEMLVLAFSKNRIQLYQPSKLRGKLSSALGRGN